MEDCTMRDTMPKETTKGASQRRELLKTALIDAAEEIICRDGLAALKARDLAAAAGCALGAIYNVFEDLDAIVFAVNMRTLALVDRDLSAAISARPTAASDDASTDDPDAGRLIRLATAYLAFAATNGPRWRALFEHRLAEGRTVPPWYVAELARLFRLVEEPLRAMTPGLDADELPKLARTVFSAVHGVVSLGLEQQLGSIPHRRLRRQTAAIVAAIARGLREAPP